MQMELKSYCVHCGGPMEYPPNLAGEKIVCPHCHNLTFLGSPKATPPPLPASLVTAPPVQTFTPPPVRHAVYATTQSTGKSIKAGMAVGALGLVLCIVFALINPICWLGVFAFAMALIVFRALKWWEHE
jgi:hypothetical protein